MMMDLDSFLDTDPGEGNATRGLISGLIGGLAGTAVKSTVERFLEVRKVDQKSAQMKIIDSLSTKITGTPVKTDNEGIAEQLVNIPLGVSVGAAYGYGKRDQTDTNLMDGALLGATTWASTHETTLPLVGLEQSPEEIPIRVQISELFSHVLYGITTEIVRSYVNERLLEREQMKTTRAQQEDSDTADYEEGAEYEEI